MISLFVIFLIIYFSVYHKKIFSTISDLLQGPKRASNTYVSKTDASRPLPNSIQKAKKISGYIKEKIEIGHHPYNYPLPYANHASLDINTIPSNALIYCDNKLLGSTPLKISSIKPGNLNLLIQKKGYFTETIKFNISKHQHLKHPTIRLKTKVGNLHIKVDLSDKTLIPPKLGSIKIGQTDWKEIDIPWVESQLKCQPYEVLLKIPGYKILSASVNPITINSGQTKEIVFKIKAAPDIFFIKGRDFFLKKQYVFGNS